MPPRSCSLIPLPLWAPLKPLWSHPMVKLDLLFAKFDYYVVTSTAPGTLPLNFSIDHEGIFLFIKPVQFAILWPWVKV